MCKIEVCCPDCPFLAALGALAGPRPVSASCGPDRCSDAMELTPNSKAS